jgi:hypothetical protein
MDERQTKETNTANVLRVLPVLWSQEKLGITTYYPSLAQVYFSGAGYET